MRILNLLVSATIEAWGEVKIHKARVVLSLVGVMVAVCALSVILAIMEITQKAIEEFDSTISGRKYSLTVNAYSNSIRHEGPSYESNNYDPHADANMMVRAQDSAQSSSQTTIDGQILDPVGQAMKRTAKLLKSNHWARVSTYNSDLKLRELDMLQAGDYDEYPSYTNTQLSFVDPDYKTIYPAKILQGRWLKDSDTQLRYNPIVISTYLYELLGAPDLRTYPTITMKNLGPRKANVTGTIVGVRHPAYAKDLNIYMTYETAPFILDPAAFAQLTPEMKVWVGTEKNENARLLYSQILSNELGPDWSAAAEYSLTNFGEQLNNTVIIVVSLVGGFIIFLGALGLLNVAIVTVRQRIREIGIRRALGASRGTVFFSVFMESVVATTIAGFIGVAAAAIIVRTIPPETMGIYISVNPAFPVKAALIGMSISITVGALCGIIPAFMAVRVKPIEAIRY